MHHGIHELAFSLQEKLLIAEQRQQQILQMVLVLKDLLITLSDQRDSILSHMDNAAIITKTGACLLTDMEVSLNSTKVSKTIVLEYSTPYRLTPISSIHCNHVSIALLKSAGMWPYMQTSLWHSMGCLPYMRWCIF